MVAQRRSDNHGNELLDNYGDAHVASDGILFEDPHGNLDVSRAIHGTRNAKVGRSTDYHRAEAIQHEHVKYLVWRERSE